MSCVDLDVPAASLGSVRLRNYIQKKGSGILSGWNHRYAVVSANFLFIYMNDKVSA